MDYTQKERSNIIRSINIRILKKAWDAYGLDASDFFIVFQITKSKYDKMICVISEEDYYYVPWNEAESVANVLGISTDVLRGKDLIELKGGFMKYVSDNFDEFINQSISSPSRRNKINVAKNDFISEYEIWKNVIKNKKYDNNNIWQATYTEIGHEIRRQIREEDMNDVQLWRFWNYMRKYKESKK